MRYNKECGKYTELIMDAIDGSISAAGKACLDEHVKTCAACKKALINNVKIIKSLSAQYEPPPFIETRIMANIKGETVKPAWQYGFRHAISFSVSFGLVIMAAFFIIYNNFGNRTINVADMPASHERAVAEKPAIKQPAPIAPAIKPAEVKIAAENNVIIKNKEATAIPAAVNTGISEHGPIKQLASSLKPAEKAPESGVVKTGETSGLAMLKPGVVPTTTENSLLDRELAIVANNLINPLRGQFATITVKVEEPANVKIVIYDKSVRPVSKILDAYKDRGTYEATWEGRTDSGETVSEGVYFVYIQIGTRVIKKSVIVNK